MSFPTDFLTICQRLRQEAGISGPDPSPTAVTGQTGELGRVVDWAADANNNINNAHATWRFLRTDFSKSITSGTQAYSPSDWSITDHATWRTHHADETCAIRIYSSVADESQLYFHPWDEFREIYIFGSRRNATGRPTYVSVKPDESLIFWPTPNATFTVNGERYREAPILAANSDTPEFPARFYMIAVWKALLDYAGWAAADERYVHASSRYTALIRKLEMDQLDRIIRGAPLA